MYPGCEPQDTGKSKGFAFLCYEDQRSTVLAVDNFNGMQVIYVYVYIILYYIIYIYIYLYLYVWVGVIWEREKKRSGEEHTSIVPPRVSSNSFTTVVLYFK